MGLGTGTDWDYWWIGVGECLAGAGAGGDGAGGDAVWGAVWGTGYDGVGRGADCIFGAAWAGAFDQSNEGAVSGEYLALKSLGCKWILASGAVGSLREEIKPRDLVVVDQLIDKTVGRAGTFFEEAAVHVELAEPMCGELRGDIAGGGDGDGESRGWG